MTYATHLPANVTSWNDLHTQIAPLVYRPHIEGYQPPQYFDWNEVIPSHPFLSREAVTMQKCCYNLRFVEQKALDELKKKDQAEKDTAFTIDDLHLLRIGLRQLGAVAGPGGQLDTALIKVEQLLKLRYEEWLEEDRKLFTKSQFNS